VPGHHTQGVYQTPSHNFSMRSHLGLARRAPGDSTPLRSLQTTSLVKSITIPKLLSVKSKSLLLHNFLFDARRFATMEPASSATMSVKDRQVPSARSCPVIYAQQVISWSQCHHQLNDACAPSATGSTTIQPFLPSFDNCNATGSSTRITSTIS
jgi:hypothetical protein